MKRFAIIWMSMAFISGFLSTGITQEPTYSGVEVCKACHSGPPGGDQYNFWLQTAHAVAYDSVAAFSAFVRARVQQSAECLQCHTTGWDPDKDNRGADDFVTVNPDTNQFNVTITDSTEFFKKTNVQCEACHGPASNHVADFVNVKPPVDVTAEACGQCHQDEHHPYIEEWLESAHSRSASHANPFLQNKFRTDPNCSGCHTFQGFLQFVGTTPEDTLNTEPNIAEPPGDAALPIVCATCHDPHDARHEGQLRLEVANLCVKCHNPEDAEPPDFPHHSTSSMWEGTGAVEFPGAEYVRKSAHQLVEPAASRKCVTCHVFMTPFEAGPPVKPASTGHTFEPRLEACSQQGCHVGVNFTDFNYRGRQTTIDSLMSILESKLASVSSADSATFAFEQALFNLRFVQSEGSRGVHNFNYAYDVLVNTINFVDTVLVTAVEPRPDVTAGIPSEFALYANYPNPFNPTTKIRFDVARKAHVKLVVFNALGQKIETLVDKKMTPGSYQVEFNASNLSSGVYFYKLITDTFVSTRKMVLIR